MANDPDGLTGYELTQKPEHDPSFAQTVGADPRPEPPPQEPRRAGAALLTETARSEVAAFARAPSTLEAPAPPARKPAPVSSAIKHYEIIRTLGEGGMGAVLLARDTKLGRLVAIKVLRNHTRLSAERFLTEARATAHCKHENIVVIHEVDELDGAPYMVLEYLEGRTLADWMDQHEPPRSSDPHPQSERDLLPRFASPSVAVELILPVVRALACAHRLGTLHRDLKPANIVLTDAGPIKVLDFGIAKRFGAGELSEITAVQGPLVEEAGLTQQGQLVGTLPYMSPEQVRCEELDARSDLWAVGVILHELCTGAHPLGVFVLRDLLAIGDLDQPMPSVSEKRPDVGALGAVIDRCLRKRRDERFGSAEELLTALEALQPGRKASDLGEDENPFAGLAAFQESDAGRFFGREREVAALTARLRNQRLMAVAGPSGAGKSSFVRAGVIPALKRSGERWETFILRPGRGPLAALAEVLAQIPEPAPTLPDSGRMSGPDPGDLDAVIASFHTQPGLLGVRLRAHCRRQKGRHRILLFIDQFEELYTQGIDPGERAAFLACIKGAADDASSPLRVMLSIRSDFLDRMADDRTLMSEVTSGLFFLPPMGREGLHEALTRPFEASGHHFEGADMALEMLAALEQTRSPLPLLQFTAAKLWEMRDRARRLLTRASYEKLGGVAGALSTHADAVLAGLTSADQRLCRAVLLRLVTPERTRAVVSLEELRGLAVDGAAVEQVVAHLCDARLLLMETGGEREGATVELCHESLIERWSKLTQWLDESELDAQFLARLRAAAQQWEASEEAEGLLWRDRAAQDAGAWLERRRAEQGEGAHLGLGTREERYLLAVVAFAERSRRLRRGLGVAVFASLSLIAVVVSLLGMRANREAMHARNEARRADLQATEGRNATRMAAARELQSDPTTALALLREIEPLESPIESPSGSPLGLATAPSPGEPSAAQSPGEPSASPSAGVPRGWSELAFRVAHSEVALVVLTHQETVTSAVWSPDGKRIVTASKDTTARVWNADGTGEPRVLRGHEGEVSAAVWSPDGKRIVTASEDRTARVWSADGAGEPLVLRGHADGITSAAWSPDGKRLVTASLDRTARVWNTDGTGEPRVLRGHEGPVTTAVWSPDGRRVVTASEDRTARIWNADGTGEPLILRGHEDEIASAAWSPDGQRVVTASKDRTARIWRADGAGEPLILRGHEDGIWSAAWSPDGQRVVTASEDNTVRAWKADGIGAPLILRGHDGDVSAAAWSPDGKRLVTASKDKTARIWRVDGVSEPLVLRGHENIVTSAAFRPDGQRIVTASKDRTARVWNADGTGAPLILRGHDGDISSAAWSPDGQRIVTASKDMTARVWSADGTGAPLILRGHEDGLLSAAFSPDGQRIVTASEDRTARVWKVDGTGEPLILRGHEGWVTSAAWSPDGQRIVTASLDKTARVWRADGTGNPILLRGHEGWIHSAAWSPDGQRIVTASLDKTARVWRADGTGEPRILHGHEGWVYSAAWSPDGQRIVTASEDNTVRVWSADGTFDPLILRGHDGDVSSAAWSPDGKRIVTASWDRTARVWTDLTPLHGAQDPRLWTSTAYCMTVERRMELLSVSDATARADQQACQRRVGEARSARGAK